MKKIRYISQWVRIIPTELAQTELRCRLNTPHMWEGMFFFNKWHTFVCGVEKKHRLDKGLYETQVLHRGSLGCFRRDNDQNWRNAGIAPCCPPLPVASCVSRCDLHEERPRRRPRLEENPRVRATCVCRADSEAYLRRMWQLGFPGEDECQTFEVSTVSVFPLCLWRTETAW